MLVLDKIRMHTSWKISCIAILWYRQFLSSFSKFDSHFNPVTVIYFLRFFKNLFRMHLHLKFSFSPLKLSCLGNKLKILCMLKSAEIVMKINYFFLKARAQLLIWMH